MKKKKEIAFTYSWDDDSILGSFHLVCPRCGTETEEEMVHINEEVVICQKCKAEFMVRRKTWVDMISTVTMKK